MQRLTTPSHTFTLPCDINTLEKIKIVYALKENLEWETYEMPVVEENEETTWNL